MASDSRISQFFSGLGDKLNEQQAVQQLKAKWEELDPQSKTYLRAAVSVGGLALIFILVLTSIFRVHGLKKEYAEKSDLLTTIQGANEELRRLRESGAAPAAAPAGGTWSAFFETTASTAGIDKAAMAVGGEKPGATGEVSKEALFDLTIKHVSVKQVVRFAYFLENGARPVKVRNLSIDTKADPAGYMDATVAVSAFTMLNK